MEYTIEFPEYYKKRQLPGRDEWNAALRSGEYKQTTGQLVEHISDPGIGEPEYCYCCLGVVSKLQGALRSRRDDWGDVVDGTQRDDFSESYLAHKNPLSSYIKSQGMFPEGVILETWMGESRRSPPAVNLADCNDRRLSLSQIADIIEAVWEDAGPLPKKTPCSH